MTRNAALPALVEKWRAADPTWQGNVTDAFTQCAQELADTLSALGGNSPQPIEAPLSDRAQPMRRDLAVILDQLYGLHVRPGHIDLVLAALGGRPETSWQPIATAPKDGRSFLAASPASSVFFAHWANGVVDGCSWTDEAGYEGRHATHWQPLPFPPLQEQP